MDCVRVYIRPTVENIIQSASERPSRPTSEREDSAVAATQLLFHFGEKKKIDKQTKK